MKLKCLITLLVSVFCLQNIYAQSNNGKVRPEYYAAGHFYNEGFGGCAIGASDMQILFEDDDESVIYFIPYSGEAPAKWKKYEIPDAKVRNFKSLKEKVNRIIKNTDLSASVMANYGHIKVGMPLPGQFTEKDIDGNTWTRASMKGKVTVVNCWFSGCLPCKKEMPELSKWKKRYPDVLFLSVNYQSKEKVREVATKHGFNWTHIYEDTYFHKWTKNGFPYFLIIDKNGIIRYHDSGTSEEIRANIEKLIQTLRASK